MLIIHLQKMVDEEELQFHEEYVNEQDPSILHFLLASGDDVRKWFISSSYLFIWNNEFSGKIHLWVICRLQANNYAMI